MVERRRQPAGQGQHQRAARGLRQSEPAVRRHRVRPLRHARRRQGVEEVHDRPAQRSRGRHPDPPARPRPDRRARTAVPSASPTTSRRSNSSRRPAQRATSTLFDPRPAVLWKNDPQAQRPRREPRFQGAEPAGRHRHPRPGRSSDLGAGKLEFLQGTQVVSTMDVQIKAGMNRFQWTMRGPAPAGAGGRGGRGGGGGAAEAAAPARESPSSPAGGRFGGGWRRPGGARHLHGPAHRWHPDAHLVGQRPGRHLDAPAVNLMCAGADPCRVRFLPALVVQAGAISGKILFGPGRSPFHPRRLPHHRRDRGAQGEARLGNRPHGRRPRTAPMDRPPHHDRHLGRWRLPARHCRRRL